ncbi:hypothetical protein pipiens_018298 [Culex pipiens pipiens]|uniref:MADF domain-containing protein n=2 Tax=Culex pipiens TaxID=7175 RepID=A0ABD1CCF4_CULPP
MLSEASTSVPAVSGFTEEDSDFQLSALVQSYPNLWDVENVQYRCERTNSDAWTQIAFDMDEGRPAVVYQTRWRYLMDCHAKYLRECNQPGTKPPYFYLANAMEFLKPNIGRKKRPVEQLKSLLAKRMKTNGGGHRETIAISDDESDEERLATTTAEKKTSSGTGRFISVDARNEDAMFLLSILPKVRQMSAERKQQFKVGLLQACDRILE